MPVLDPSTPGCHRLPPAATCAAYHAIACGADVNHSYHAQPAARLVWECNMQAGGDADQPLSPTNLGHTGVLHTACTVGGRRVGRARGWVRRPVLRWPS